MCNNNLCGSHRNPCVNVGPFTAFVPQCETARRQGYMIAYASGTNNFTLVDFDIGVGYFNPHSISFGNQNSVTLAAGNVTVSDSNDAFSVSQASSISAISASFTFTDPINLPTGTTAKIRAQIYKAAAGASIFNPTDAFVDLILPTNNAGNSIIYDSANTFTPVQIGVNERVLMVYNAITTGTFSEEYILGTASASITIV